MATGLIRRNGRYSIRRIIPVDLQPHYGRREIVRALGTASPLEARRLHARAWVDLDDEFEVQRVALGTAEATPTTLANVIPMPRRQTSAPPEKLATSDGAALSDVVERWATERKPTDRTARRTRNIVERFEAVNGDLTVQAVTKAHVLAFKDALLAEGQTAANTNVMIPMLGVVLNYAVANDLIATNPAAGIRVTDNRRAKDKRREFDEAALDAIFRSPVYVRDARPFGGCGEAAYWLPLIGLYTGARLNELGQLHPDDVMHEAYRDGAGNEERAWVIRLVENRERGQELKTEGSERRIPVHDDLIALGLLTLVQEAKGQGRHRVFHELRPDRDGKVTGNWSKWFGRYRRKECGLAGKDTPFHSFRHSFKHYARLSGIPSEIHNELTGHETGDVANSYGGLSYPLLPLVEAMAKYRVPGPEAAVAAPRLQKRRRFLMRTWAQIISSRQGRRVSALEPSRRGEVRNVRVHGLRDLYDTHEADIALSPLHFAHVRPVNPSGVR